jgi:glycosyltransferase involved in cell wall biosynthesis
MKIVLISSFVPFIDGGGRFIVEWLETKLLEHGHRVERFYLPFIDSPDALLEQITAFRLIDVSESCDRLIAFRPPSHVVRHPNKVLWFIHHIRIYYDLWDSRFRPVPDTATGRSFRQALFDLDTRTISEAKKVFTNSQTVADRLQKYNGLAAQPLYPPILNPSRFRHDGYGDEIVAICRIVWHKRQKLLVEAMRFVKTDVRLRICGEAFDPQEAQALCELATSCGHADRIIIENRWISEEEKADYLASALAVAYLPVDEDSYGYPSLEAAHSRKCVITATDSGGVLELVEHGRNGLIVPPDPVAFAEAMDTLYRDRASARRMGEANLRRLTELKIDWSHVVEALTS